MGIIDRSHAMVSGGLEAFLSRADALFAGSESLDAPTGSYLRLGLSSSFYLPKHGGHDFRVLLRAKVRLPKTNNKLQVIVDRGLETFTRSESQTEAERALGQTTRDDDFFIGLRAIVAETFKVNLTADTGLRFSGLSPDPFVRGRAQHIFEAGQWKVPLSETLLWRRLDATSAATELAFLREISPSSIVSVNSNATFRFRPERFDLSQVISYSNRLDDDSLISVEAGAFGHTRPELQVTAYTVALRYRKRLYRDWVLMEIRPQLSFPRERDFDTVPSITFGIEAYFGKTKFPDP